jgi:hypothetical protein
VKLLKFSIFLTFILSLLGAGLTFYLSNVRENEKEKRLYLEGIRTKLESDVQSLQAEVQKLEAENKELQQKMRAEQSAKEQVLALVENRDSDMKQLEQEAESARQAFGDAQRRNQELEKILDDLEARIQDMEAQKELSGPDIGVVGLQVIPPSESLAIVSPELDEAVSADADSVPEPVLEPEIEEAPSEEILSPVSTVTPVTETPKPRKKRKFLGWLRSSKSDQKEPEVQDASENEIATEEISEEPAPAPVVSIEEVKLTQVPAETKEPANQQTIAAGNVLLINRVHNFAVINLGSRHGLALNDVLHIQRDGAEVAKVRVEKLYEDYCAAYIVEEQSGKPIEEGDVAGIA